METYPPGTSPLQLITLGAALVMLSASGAAGSPADPQVRTVHGLIKGTTDPSGIRVFRGIPFAEPPVGELRWKRPRPAQDWEGVRPAQEFGPRPMQRPIFGDMNFRSARISEDCLYLNVWTPASTGKERLPVLVYFYGGGFVAGDGSEPRYDGLSMARKGIVVVTANYRLGVFGYLAHPELTGESPHHASGNYGLLDQNAALQWVRRNISAFGGDPKRVTIGGESAGSFSVSAQMASPLSRDLFSAAIGESGSVIRVHAPIPLADAERFGERFSSKVGAKSLAELRKLPAEQLLEATADMGMGQFPLAIDGHFLPRDPEQIFAAGKQARVPLLVGWNSEEMNYRAVLGSDKPTRENFARAVQRLYGEHAPEVLDRYVAATDEEVEQVATDLASDRFLGLSTWIWADLHGRTGGQPIYRYFYTRPRPPMRPEYGDAVPGLAGGVRRGSAAQAGRQPPARGAVHSAEIEYALGNLASNHIYAWTQEDYRISEVMQGYFANFIKSHDPNGGGLPVWPPANHGKEVRVMRLDVLTRLEAPPHEERYRLLDRLSEVR